MVIRKATMEDADNLRPLYLELEKIAIIKFHQSILRYFRVGSDSDESPMCKFSLQY